MNGNKDMKLLYVCVCVCVFFIWKINAYYIDMFQVMHLWLTQMEGQNRLKQRKQTPARN